MINNDSDSSREWAAQAYALLKKKQEEAKQELQKQEEAKQEETKQELQKQEEAKLELSELKTSKSVVETVSNEPKVELGEFNDDFTW